MNNSKNLLLTNMKFENGERYPILLGPNGSPEWHPTLFVTSYYRNASKAPGTAYAALSAIRQTLRWADGKNLELVARFLRREFLTTNEIESLVASLRQRASQDEKRINHTSPKQARGLERVRMRTSQPKDAIGKAFLYQRLSYAAEYLQWLSRHVIEQAANGIDEATARCIADMGQALRSKRPNIRRRGGNNLRKAQPLEEELTLLKVAQVDHSENPFTKPTTLRNHLIIIMLDELGLRAGELLATKVTDIDFQAQEIIIERRHHDPEDPRQNQPVVKTLDRRLPMSDELTSVLTEYVLKQRRQLPRALLHPMLLVSARSSRSGKTGDPLSRQALSAVTSTLSAKLPQGSQHVHPHLLRHNAATRMYRQLSGQGVSEARIAQLLEWKFGWAEGSGSARTYIESEAQRQSIKVQRELQDKWSEIRSEK